MTSGPCGFHAGATRPIPDSTVTEPRENPPTDTSSLRDPPEPTSSRYDRVTDLITGPSRRLFDNLVSLGGFVVGAGVGIPVAHTWNLPLPDFGIVACGMAAG